MRTRISNLPSELVEEILSRVPVKSMEAVRSTCKTWKSLSKDTIFTNKHIGKVAAGSAIAREFVMIKDYSVHLISVNLYETHNKNNFDLSIHCQGQLITRETSHHVCNIFQIFHCNGLLLCVFKPFKNDSLVVWNPYLGQSRWIKLRNNNHILDCSDSWKVINATLDRDIKIPYGNPGVSLKGNTYWYARVKGSQDCFLLCFDFTSEIFGPRLRLPFDSSPECNVSLSAVREEQLALFVELWDTNEIEIWVTNIIESDAVSWSKFLSFDMKPLAYFIEFTSFFSDISRKIFFIEEEKKIAVVFGEDRLTFKACMIGEKGYFKRVDLRESADIQLHLFRCS
ncbi:hypothetical protein EUTSA_v10022075mg [Eutrema salsugineum]|uniref:F-box domain-containing protein n=1 Tax=Eutrema salsugineum TaxID=72664 RepID=V4NMX8_EUTSA|nr:putative F-box protein At3g20705 [Eutrema salsugineum]ESQ47811.1 hypothetical protein EUTSA_v10022075mg [Eutrema salsugineum]